MEKVVIEPDFLPLRKVKTKRGWKRNLINGLNFGRNVSRFYSHVYAALYGGELCRHYKGDTEKIFHGLERNIHPDIIRLERKNKVYVEVKAGGSGDSRVFCGQRQLENYCHRVLKELHKFKRGTSFEYASFRYDYSPQSRAEDTEMQKMEGPELGEELSKRTLDLLVIPSNLLFLLLANSSLDPMNHCASKSDDVEVFWRTYARHMGELRKGNGIIQSLSQKLNVYPEEIRTALCLNLLAYEQTDSPGNLYCGEQKIQPFKITRYFNMDERRWDLSFKEHHEVILKNLLRARDIFEEHRSVPF